MNLNLANLSLAVSIGLCPMVEYTDYGYSMIFFRYPKYFGWLGSILGYFWRGWGGWAVYSPREFGIYILSYHASVFRGWIYNPFELALCRTGQDFLGHQDFKNHGLIKKGKIRSPILFSQFAQVRQSAENINLLPNFSMYIYNFFNIPKLNQCCK